MRRPFLFLLCIFISTGVSARRSPAELSQELRIAMSQEFENPNPLIMQMAATSYIYRMCGRTLNVLSPEGELVEQLAVKTPRLNDGAEIYEEDGVTRLRATWEIKPEATWGDGTPVTGHDVVFSWEVARSENVSVGEKEMYDNIEKILVDPANPKRFTLHHRSAKWDFYKMYSFYIVPKHLEEDVFRAHGNTALGYDKNSRYTTSPTEPGLYNGPYVITEVRLGSHVILKPNPHFYGPRPRIQTIILRFIPDTATLTANLLAGDVDMISVLGLDFDQALAFRDQAGAAGLPYRVLFEPGIVYEHLDLNLNHPILQDQRVRKALVHAINRDSLCRELFGNEQKPAIHNIAPIDPWFTDDPGKIFLYRYSLRQARRLLEAAGWELGDDGYRYRKGEKLRLQLMTTAGNKVRSDVQQWLQNEWKRVGIEATIKNEPANVFFGETVRKGKYPALAMYAWLSSPENTPRSTFHSNSIPTAENAYSGQNSGGWKHAEVDRLIDELEREFDAEARLVLIHRILYHYTNEVPVIPLYYRSNTAVVPSSMNGYRLSGHQFSSSNHVENWEFK